MNDDAGTTVDDQGRVEPPLAADEAATLLGFLDFQRDTFAWKCSGVDAVGMRATVGSSSMTLGGLLKHLAYVEDDWTARWLRGGECPAPWDAVDWAADPDWEWHSAASQPPEELLTLWRESVARSRAAIETALDEDGLDGLARRSFSDGGTASLRWIVVHLIEEYAQHNGHADLLRESVDGQTGE